MPRPGPLREWSLEPFLRAESKKSDSGFGKDSRPTKRPRSPGGPILYSPAKKRILTQEGIFSPDKTLKSPVRDRTARQSLTAGFLFDGEPAKRLDFDGALPLRFTDDSSVFFDLTPKDHRSSPNVPELEVHDYFSTPSSRTVHPSSLFKSRLLPGATDPKSIHYPGFDVFQEIDTCSASSPQTDEENVPLESDKEEYKENMPMKRGKGKKVTSSQSSDASVLPSPESKRRATEKPFKVVSVLSSPRRSERLGTPPRPFFGIASLGSFSPSREAVAPDDKRRLRQMLNAEVDGIVESSDDDELEPL